MTKQTFLIAFMISLFINHHAGAMDQRRGPSWLPCNSKMKVESQDLQPASPAKPIIAPNVPTTTTTTTESCDATKRPADSDESDDAKDGLEIMALAGIIMKLGELQEDLMPVLESNKELKAQNKDLIRRIGELEKKQMILERKNAEAQEQVAYFNRKSNADRTLVSSLRVRLNGIETRNLQRFAELRDQQQPQQVRILPGNTEYTYNALWDLPLLRRLIADKKVDLTTRDFNGYMPLHWAAQFGRVEAAKLLIQAGAPVDAVCVRGFHCRDWGRVTPLCLAAQLGHVALARILMAAGASMNRIGDGLPLHSAVMGMQQSVPLVAEFIAAGASVDEKGPDYPFDSNINALHLAVRWGNPEAAKILLSAGADINAKNVFGATPLQQATDFDEARKNTKHLLRAWPAFVTSCKPAWMSLLAAMNLRCRGKSGIILSPNLARKICLYSTRFYSLEEIEKSVRPE